MIAWILYNTSVLVVAYFFLQGLKKCQEQAEEVLQVKLEE